MPPIVASVEIDRTPEDVFAYVGDLRRHGEWQEQIVSVDEVSDGPVGVGTRATETRRVPGSKVKTTYEITEWDSPRRASFRGVDGPVRPLGTLTIEPLDGGSRSRATIQLDFEGHGIGKLLVPLMVRRDARKRVPKDQQNLKQRLESGA